MTVYKVVLEVESEEDAEGVRTVLEKAMAKAQVNGKVLAIAASREGGA